MEQQQQQQQQHQLAIQTLKSTKKILNYCDQCEKLADKSLFYLSNQREKTNRIETNLESINNCVDDVQNGFMTLRREKNKRNKFSFKSLLFCVTKREKKPKKTQVQKNLSIIFGKPTKNLLVTIKRQKKKSLSCSSLLAFHESKRNIVDHERHRKSSSLCSLVENGSFSTSRRINKNLNELNKSVEFIIARAALLNRELRDQDEFVNKMSKETDKLLARVDSADLMGKGLLLAKSKN